MLNQKNPPFGFILCRAGERIDARRGIFLRAVFLPEFFHAFRAFVTEEKRKPW